jgi:hypothetical protein
VAAYLAACLKKDVDAIRNAATPAGWKAALVDGEWKRGN